MLCGLFMVIWWIPAENHGPDGEVKTLKEWQVRRGENNFSTTWLAMRVAAVYKWLVKAWDVIYLWLDSINGEEEAQRRELEAQRR
jgi:hypothetical protein